MVELKTRTKEASPTRRAGYVNGSPTSCTSPAATMTRRGDVLWVPRLTAKQGAARVRPAYD